MSAESFFFVGPIEDQSASNSCLNDILFGRITIRLLALSLSSLFLLARPHSPVSPNLSRGRSRSGLERRETGRP